jgi:predicted lactoylglutathione lyase
MATKIFVNLPVKDLDVSMTFFKKLGYSFNPQFTDDTAACMVVAEDIYVMLLTHKKFTEFTPRPIADANASTEVLTCLSFDSREEVDRITNRAIGSGGSEARPATDYGFMYGRSFSDPDGHIWEAIWMDPSFVNAEHQPAKQKETGTVA